MKKTCLGLVILLAGCNQENRLESKEQPLELSYIAWACDCANWASQEDRNRHGNEPDSLAAHCVYIEPANPSLDLPDTLGYNGDRLVFTGRFYKENGFPKSHSSPEHPDKARVFRYTAFRVIESNYRDSKKLSE